MKHLLILISAFALFSCSKENSDTFYPYPVNPVNDTTWLAEPGVSSPVNQLENVLVPASSAVFFNASTGATLRFPRNLEITIPPAGCVSANGTPVTGEIRVDVLYLRTKGDMIRFARPTTSFNRLLESGGAVNIRASKNGDEVMVAPNKTITIRFREANPQNNMRVFYGEQVAGSNLPGTNFTFTWVPASDSSRVNTFQQTDSSGAILRGYEMLSKRFRWVNCDYFVDTTQSRGRVNTILPPNFTNSNTSVYAAFKDQRIVVRLNADFANKFFYALNMPLGKNFTLVSLSKIGDDFYYAAQETGISANMIHRLTPEKKTKAQVEQLLDQL